MKYLRLLLINCHLSRPVSTTNINNKNNDKVGKFLHKLLSKNVSKGYNKVTKVDINCLPGIPNIDTETKIQSSSRIKRKNVLNKLFMKHITDLLSSGDIAMELAQRSVEILDVQVTTRLERVDVIWFEHYNNNVTYIVPTEELLQNYASSMRHELLQIQVLSCIPPINFVKSNRIEKMIEVGRKLNLIQDENSASVEESQKPTQSELCSLNLPVTIVDSNPDKCNILNDNKCSNHRNNTMENNLDISIPLMHNNVFGLDHYNMMTKIKSSLVKSKPFNDKKTSIVSSKLDISSESSTIGESQPDTKDLITKFLAKRKLEKKYKYSTRKLRREAMYKDMEDDNSYEQELNENSEDNSNNFYDKNDEYDR